MNSDPLENGDESKDGISGLRVAAFGEVIIHILDIHIHLNSQSFQVRFVHILRVLTDNRRLFRRQEHLAEVLHVFLSVSDRLVHIRHFFVSQLECHTGDVRLGVFEFPVLEPPLDDLLALRSLFVLNLFERLADLILRLGRYNYIEPIGIGTLVRRSHDRDLIAVFQFLPDGDILIANSTADAVRPHFAVYGIGEIKYSRPFRQASQIARRSEDIDISRLLNDRSFDAFVRPVRRHSLLRHLVHAA